MNYTIYHSKTTLPNSTEGIGLEIQPPLTKTAESTATMLAQQPEGFSNGTEHLAKYAVVTRNDSEGTAIIVTPNRNILITSADLAKKLGELVNPCDQHEIDYVPPIPE